MRRDFLFGLVCAALVASSTSAALANIDAAEATKQAAMTSPVGNYLAGRTAADLRDLTSASVYLRAALRADPKNQELLDRTFRTVLAAGDVEQAMSLAERVAASDPNNRLARLALAIKAIKAKQFVAARTQLGQSPKGPIPDVVATLVSAWAWQGSGDVSRAIKTADTLSGNELAEMFRDLHAGLIAGTTNNKAEAERRLAAAYKLNDSSFVVVDAYARALANGGKTKEALDVYKALAQRMTRNERLANSIASLEKGEKLPPAAQNARDGVTEALFGFGQLANRGESAEIGLVYLNLALYLEPDHEFALLTLADLLETIGQHDEAIAAYERVPQTSAFKQDVGIRIAANLAMAERTSEAEAKLRDIIAKDPKDVDAIVALANLLHRQKSYVDAAKVFTQAIEATGEPKKSDWSLYFARGVAYDAAKDWKNAEPDLIEANRLDPEQPVVLNYLGYSWVDRSVSAERGLELIRKAVELRPNDGDIVDSLGWAYYKLGRYEDATKELERAVELKPQSWEINDHLGDVYWKTGRKLEAKFQWLHALTLEIDDEKRGPVERKISEGLEPVEQEMEARKAAERAQLPQQGAPRPKNGDRAEVSPGTPAEAN